MAKADYSADEMMTIAAARLLRDRQVCFVGIGLPSAAANLARLTHAPNIALIYESGTIGTRPDILPLSIGDGILAETADALVSVPEMFRYWLQGGRIDIGFLGAAQVDKYGNINTTVIGDYRKPKVRLPGAGGAPEIATAARDILIIIRHSPRAFVEKVDFITSVGLLDATTDRRALGIHGNGPAAIVTDLGILKPDPKTRELVLASIHPGVAVEQVRDATGWPLRVIEGLPVTEPPRSDELGVLRDLNERSKRANEKAVA
ncbi:MAG TPA: CoA-transferase subunit beta [Candidatus Binataceae bacterium]|nr:CoA-transferase subunit beta [Candidatus Binataceae bacterium]